MAGNKGKSKGKVNYTIYLIIAGALELTALLRVFQ
jgi:hypothetical protein